jgi:hypothetical protein
MSRRRNAESPAPNPTVAQRRRTANDDLSASLIIPVRTSVKIGARDLLKLNPKALVQDAGGNEETLKQLRTFGRDLMEEVQSAQAANCRNKTRPELVNLNSCFACRKIGDSDLDILKCQCYYENYGDPSPDFEELTSWVHLCLPCGKSGELGSGLCPGCNKLICPHCSDACQGKEARNCKKLICMGCETDHNGWVGCWCKNYRCCTDFKDFQPNPNKIDGKCNTCNILLCDNCDYETCVFCEKNVCEEHAVVYDEGSPNPEDMLDEYGEISCSYLCEGCDESR